MSIELGMALVNLCIALAAIIKVMVQQSSSKKVSDTLETEVSILKEKIARLDKLDDKFDQVNNSLIEVKTQLGMLLTMNGIKTKQ